MTIEQAEILSLTRRLEELETAVRKLLKSEQEFQDNDDVMYPSYLPDAIEELQKALGEYGGG